ncbi:putative membrane protein [Lachnospiraceae bacterium JC7]|nr:putative membrane protein [Lachnospiraceae bacterium JC7]
MQGDGKYADFSSPFILGVEFYRNDVIISFMSTEQKTINYKWIPFTTYILIGINVIVFLFEELCGGSENLQTALNFGALYTPYVFFNGQIYRIFTSIFLHFGVEHLGANMISLCAIGPYVEHYFGHFLFLVLYIFSGLIGNMVSMFFEWNSGIFSISAGASGAIFGLLSVFILFALNPKLRRVFPIQRVILSIFLSLVAGLNDPSIDFAAHFGGLVGGLILAFIMQEIIRFSIRRERLTN